METIGEKIFYEICPFCKRENECYKVLEISKGIRTKGQFQYLIRCKRLDDVNKQAEKRVNKMFNKK